MFCRPDLKGPTMEINTKSVITYIALKPQESAQPSSMTKQPHSEGSTPPSQITPLPLGQRVQVSVLPRVEEPG